MSFFKKIFSKEKKETLDKGLEKSKSSFFDKLNKAVAGKSSVDDDVLDMLEEVLVSSDVGVTTTLKVITRIEARVAKDKYVGTGELNAILREEIAGLLSEIDGGDATDFEVPKHESGPHVIMVVGVNGVGKTTTIGKLANQFKNQGLHVVLGAADTFRAAAVAQLETWADRTGAKIVSGLDGGDSAAVAYKAVEKAKIENIDIVIIDTAGRLQNKKDLMEELTKTCRVVSKLDPDAPHQKIVVLDGTVGQNAHSQLKIFNDSIGLTGMIITKLDGSAKGGVVVSLAEKFKIPIHAVGVGEGLDDLQDFKAVSFSRALAGLDEL